MTLDFCCWNLNSIAAYDFLRVSLIEAYNSVFNYDLLAIAETHIDSTIDEGRLALDGYSFMKGNHPHNVKKGGVGLYVTDSLPSKARSDLAILPECIVHEIHLNKKSTFSPLLVGNIAHELAHACALEFNDITLSYMHLFWCI